MKRSSQLALVAVVGVTAVVAYSWNSKEAEAEAGMEGTVFSSIDDCISSGESRTDCTARFQQAYNAHATAAPRYDKQEDCERDFGQRMCKQGIYTTAGDSTASTASAGSSYFIPTMVGFMAARMMQGAQAGTAQQAYPAQPMYSCPSGTRPSTNTDQGKRCYSSRYGNSFFSGVGLGMALGSRDSARQVRTPVGEFRGNGVSRFNVVPRGGSIANFAGPSRSAVSSRGGFGSTGRGFSGTSMGG